MEADSSGVAITRLIKVAKSLLTIKLKMRS
jgi:hypothetical protein